MSRLGSQIDGLRTAAQTERTLGHHELEQMLLDAADTIWELRDDLQCANDATQDAEHDESIAWDRVRKAEAESASLRGAAQGLGELCDKYKAENAKLREDLEDQKGYDQMLRDRLRQQTELRVKAEAENAKLRELVQNLRRVTPADVVGVVIGANTDHPSYYKFDKAFRELGIEVDDGTE